jgi:hypothetical protein
MKALHGEEVHATSRNVLFLSVERNGLLANINRSKSMFNHTQINIKQGQKDIYT